MISATHFGEITELDSRAVWYSDEEDEDEDDTICEAETATKLNPVIPVSHETFRSNIHLNFQRVTPNIQLKFTTCVISLSSHFKNAKFSNSPSLVLLGNFDSVGQAYAYPVDSKDQQAGQTDEYLLWLVFDSTNQHLVGHGVGYFVEILLERFQTEFHLNHSGCQVIILSSKYSCSEHLEYLINYKDPKSRLPFIGCPLAPPSIITNQFESSLFEQLTLDVKPALIACLPDPKNFWFDKTKNWPSVPDSIIAHKLNDDNLDKTLIFT